MWNVSSFSSSRLSLSLSSVCCLISHENISAINMMMKLQKLHLLWSVGMSTILAPFISDPLSKWREAEGTKDQHGDGVWIGWARWWSFHFWWNSAATAESKSQINMKLTLKLLYRHYSDRLASQNCLETCRTFQLAWVFRTTSRLAVSWCWLSFDLSISLTRQAHLQHSQIPRLH